VSTDQGLDQDFNSLDAQYEAAAAYIKSQAHAGWTLIRSRYDDGGYSGGSTDRPDLQRLLEDIRARRIDVIVVYKVDRLTRSLADFAKLVELFDANAVSFVSVTQQFNTTTSMGRLTLNVLLSFAQFEREVTSERIRDKIAASKRKGLWVGGPLPLGYAMRDGKVAIVEEEAEHVRLIFRKYLELGSIHTALRYLRTEDVRTKTKFLKSGDLRGGVPFGRGSLSYLLRNRFYIGEVKYRGEILPGEQPPLLDRALFEAVQQKLTCNWLSKSTDRNPSNEALAGQLYDDLGHRMVPTHSKKGSVRYRYYVSLPLLYGKSEETPVGTVSRVPAPDVEKVVREALEKKFRRTASEGELLKCVERIEIGKDRLLVHLKTSEPEPNVRTITIPWKKPPSRRSREILIPNGHPRQQIRPMKFERRMRLITAIARGRTWLHELVSGAASRTQDIAKRHKCSPRHVEMTISLAFLAPVLVKAAVEGRLPRGIGVERLRDASAEWSQQLANLGLHSELAYGEAA
jgi:DNA invertase Pin-like site-specific DNA recombinase